MRVAIIVALLFASPVHAQVFRVDGGASSLLNADGASVTMFTTNNEASIGAGISDGHFTVGASDKFQYRGLDVIAGDYNVSLTTESAGLSLPTRGLFVGKKSKRTEWHVFTAACGRMYSAPYFEGTSARQFCAGYAWKFTTTRFELSSVAAYDAKFSALESAVYHWQGLKLSGTVGEVNGSRLLNGIADYHNEHFSASASRGLYAFNGQTATVDSLAGSVRFGALSFNASDYQSTTNGKITTGQSIGASANLGSTAFVASNFFSKYGRQGLYGVNRSIGPHWIVSAYVNTSTTVSASFGGSYIGNRFSANVGWSENYYPFIVNRSPWQKTLSATITVKIHDTAVTLASVVLPQSGIKFSASGSQYLYRESDLSPATRTPSASSVGKYSVRVSVADADNAAIGFAVVYVGNSACVTDSQGVCEVRFRKSRLLCIRVAVDEFPTGPYAVADAPSTVTPTTNGATITVKVSRPSMPREKYQSSLQETNHND
jgi:hypothetical protein